MPKIGREPGAPPWKAAAALIILVLAGGWGCRASAADQSRLNEEFIKQEKIYRSRGAEVPGGYVTYRTLAAYAELLPSGFGAALKRLGSGDRWLARTYTAGFPTRKTWRCSWSGCSACWKPTAASTRCSRACAWRTARTTPTRPGT